MACSRGGSALRSACSQSTRLARARALRGRTPDRAVRAARCARSVRCRRRWWPRGPAPAGSGAGGGRGWAPAGRSNAPAECMSCRKQRPMKREEQDGEDTQPVDGSEYRVSESKRNRWSAGPLRAPRGPDSEPQAEAVLQRRAASARSALAGSALAEHREYRPLVRERGTPIEAEQSVAHPGQILRQQGPIEAEGVTHELAAAGRRDPRAPRAHRVESEEGRTPRSGRAAGATRRRPAGEGGISSSRLAGRRKRRRALVPHPPVTDVEERRDRIGPRHPAGAGSRRRGAAAPRAK